MNNKLNLKMFNDVLIITLIGIMVGVLIIILNHLGVLSLINNAFNAIIPIFLAIFLSFLLEPLIQKLENLGLKRVLAVILIYLSLLIIILLALLLLIPSLINEIKNFLENLPSIIDGIYAYLEDFLKYLGIDDLKKTIDDEINNNVSLDVIYEITYVVEDVLYLSLSFVGALFLSFDFKSFKRKTKKMLPKKVKKPILSFLDEIIPYIYKYFRGILFTTLILFCISSLALVIIGLDNALFYAFIIALFNLIPIVGAYIGIIPALLVAFATSLELGIIVLVTNIIVQIIIGNFINPFVMKNVINLHPLEGLFSLLLFGSLFGVVGMILSPLLMVSIKIIYKEYKAFKRHHKILIKN